MLTKFNENFNKFVKIYQNMTKIRRKMKNMTICLKIGKYAKI